MVSMVRGRSNTSTWTHDLDAHAARLKNMSAIWPAVEELFQRIKDRDFRGGRGPAGPHRAMKASTRRRHRTGVSLYNTEQLADSFRRSGHAHYHWTSFSNGWRHHSSVPYLVHLVRKGYVVTGLSAGDWALIDKLVGHWLATGEILSLSV